MVPQSGENLLFHGHPSWRSMPGFHAKGLLLAVLIGAIAGLASAVVSGRVQLLAVIIAVLAVFVAVAATGLVRRLRTTYTITNQRLTIETGLLSRELHETRLDRVQNVNSRQSMLERVLGVGTVDFDTAGGASFGFSFRGVAHPRGLVRTVDRALRMRSEPGPV
jgi:uncharacterized membrane protein YdbT with pleckstrin-like domain